MENGTVTTFAQREDELAKVIRMMIEDHESVGGKVTQATINRGKDVLGIKYKEDNDAR